MLGFLVAPIAKLAGLGTLTKAAAAVSTAALTMTVAGGAAGVFQPPDGPPPAVVVQQAAPQATASVGSAANPAPSTEPGETEARTTTGASASAPTGSGSVKATTAASSAPAANLPSLPAVPTPAVPTVSAPAVPALPALPSCVANLIPTGGTPPDPIRLVSQLPACILSVVTASLPLDAIESAIGSANLPVDVSACLSSVLSSLPAFAGGDLSGLQRLLTGCLPTGSIPGGTFPGMGSLPGMESISGMGSFSAATSGR